MLLALLTQSFEVMAKDFGVQGEVFEIGEPDMLEYIQAKLKQMERDGTLALKQKGMRRKAEKYVHRPLVSNRLEPTRTSKIWEYDPTYIVPEDIKDQDGNILYHKGYKYNPLEHRPLESNLVFIDGDEEQQVKWALNLAAAEGKLPKIILVNGEPLRLMKKHKIRMYFDQHNVLTKKFGITQVPAVVSQKGNKLSIEEIKLGAE
jgi:conjugal transfer pilus assembly protein TraW